MPGNRDRAIGPKLPVALMPEITSKEKDEGKSYRRTKPTISRKDRRKQEREEKKKHKRQAKTQGLKNESHNGAKPVNGMKPVKNGVLKKKASSVAKPEKSKKSVKFDLPLAEDEEVEGSGPDATEDFEDFDSLDDFEDLGDSDDFEDFDEDMEDFEDFDDEEDDSMSVEDTMAALKAAKEKKKGMSAAETMAALKASKEKKKETSADETMAALKAAKEKKAMSVDETMAALKAAKDKKKGSKKQDDEKLDDSMSAEDTMAALKAAKEKKKGSKTQDDETLDDSMSAEDTMAALKAAKEKKSSKKRKMDDINDTPKGKKKLKSKKHDRPPVDPHEAEMMARDEAEMEYYAKKLGLKSMKLDNADDGLGDILGGLDFEDFAAGSESEYSESDYSQDVEEDGDDASASDDEVESLEDEEDEEEPKVEKQKENPYVAPVAATTKYVPPRRRALMEAQGESESLIKLRKQVKGLFNRLSEANMGTIINDIENLYLNNPRSEVSSVVTEVVIESTAVQGMLTEQFLIVHAALVTALYKTIGIEFGAHFVQTLIERFERNREVKKEAINLLSLLSQVYGFQMVACKLMYDLIKTFLEDINELNTEFLLKVVDSAGPQLRSDDPASLKDIIFLLHTNIAKLKEGQELNSRTKFLVERITDLKNNRHRRSGSEVSQDTIARLKKFLGAVQGTVSDPIQVSLEDIHNVDTKGKWWLVGAAWKNNMYNGSANEEMANVDVKAMHDVLDSSEPNWLELAKAQRMNTDIRRAVFVAIMSSEDYIDAHDRLQKLKLKNKQEREIPRVLLHCCGSEQVYNPFYSLVAARLCTHHSLKKTFQFALWDYLGTLEGEDSDMDNSGSESDPQAELQRLKKKSEEESQGDLHKTINYARLYAHLVSEGVMSIDVLKTTNFFTAVSEVQIFLEMFFIHLFQLVGKRAESSDKTRKVGFNAMLEDRPRDESGLVNILSNTKDETTLRGVRYLQGQIEGSSTLKSLKKKQADRVRWGCQVTRSVVDRLLQRDVL
uniref:ARAD1B08096p n=1 Tax=Blastobotrys adeninivorans TaxID=409370 RepID=A0A060TAN4_BLAAD